MPDGRLEQELSLARRATPSFGLARQQRVIWGVRRRSQRSGVRLHRLLPAIAAACVVAVVAGAYTWFRFGTHSTADTPLASDERWQLRDGSRILIETPETRITKQRESDREVAFELAAGAARFDVAHRPERIFRVQAGLVRVEVLGTSFRVERRAEGALVSVERGRVRVSWPDASEELAAGEAGVFPKPKAAEVAPRPPAPTPSARSASTDVRETAPAPSAKSANDLFGEADRARANGHPREAATALRQLMQRFPRDARAPLAAFTLGRVLLENLGHPADAARAFAQARAIAGARSALAEDALAREVEAWHAAGNLAEAREHAELYRSQYPQGARLQRVLRAGNLSAPP